MDTQVEELVERIANTRRAMLERVQELTDAQGAHRPDARRWSAAQIVEHLCWAEQSGLHKMSVAIDAHRRGAPVWAEPNPNRDRSIEAIVAETWQPREQAPPVAEPTWGGPLSYWSDALAACQPLVGRVAARVRADELDEVVYPHYLSGPLTLRQRLGFLAFHIERHAAQVDALRSEPSFPEAA